MSTSEADSLVLRLEGFEGPLDLLLDLARAQKVDLAKISILALVEQYLAVIEGARRVRLELAADWLVMAAWLTWLKSRLLVPDGAEAEEAEQAADVLAVPPARPVGDPRRRRVAGRPAAARPRRLRPRRARGPHRDRPLPPGAGPVVAGARLSRRRCAARSGTRRYQPRPVTLWSVKDALQRLARLLGSLPDWTSLDQFLPATLGGPLERRAALASTLLAGLEMAREGAVRLRQEDSVRPDPGAPRLRRSRGGRMTEDEALRLAEALVFASAEPVGARALSQLLPEDMDADAVLAALRERYAGRGVELVEAGGGVQFRTAPDLAPLLRKVIEIPRRLPRVAMETLAIIAYHQPVTRPEIEEIRGTSLSQQTLDALLEADLIAPKGRRESPGRPTLWGTTPHFLAQFGLKDLRELPRREDLLLEPLPCSATTASPAKRGRVGRGCMPNGASPLRATGH